jgi:CBS domain-containing protein
MTRWSLWPSPGSRHFRSWMVGGLFEGSSVRDLMTSPALTITPDAGVREAAQRMLDAGVHRLIVIRGEQVVGVISTTDIMRAVATGRL